MTGSARYKWEQENGIFQFEGRPTPKLLAAISNAQWDRMMWGPYFNDRPEYYACWIDFCLKYNPAMKFYLSDAWPQLYQLESPPASEENFTPEMFERMGKEKNRVHPTKAYVDLKKCGHDGPICSCTKDFRREIPACPQACCTMDSGFVTTVT